MSRKGSELAGISNPYAGMSRIRFDGFLSAQYQGTPLRTAYFRHFCDSAKVSQLRWCKPGRFEVKPAERIEPHTAHTALAFQQ